MRSRIPNTPQIALALIALISTLSAVPLVSAHDGSHSSSATQSMPPVDRYPHRSEVETHFDTPFIAPHAGQLSKTTDSYFEVVYGPYETRIYVYDTFRSPKSARGMLGAAIMQVQSNGQEFRYPLHFVPVTEGQDYLAIKIDLTRVRDGDMKVNFALGNVPSEIEQSARVTQVFLMSRPPTTVAVVPLTEADGVLIETQRVCPVMDAGLSEHGQPIKLMVDDQPLFVCCEDCISEVENNPQKYVAKVTAVSHENRQPSRPTVSVFWAGDADMAAIQAQAICPVMDQPLGAHGRPLKVLVDGQPLFVCCEGCINQAVQNPAFYFAKSATHAAPEGIRSLPGEMTPPSEQGPSLQQIGVAYATEADQPATQAQGVCPITNQPLGAHGTPIKITVDSRELFVCCQGCVTKVEQNADYYFSRLVPGRPAGPLTVQETRRIKKSTSPVPPDHVAPKRVVLADPATNYHVSIK